MNITGSIAPDVRNGIPAALEVQGNDVDLSDDYLSEILHLMSDIVVISETRPIHVPRSRLVESPVDHINKVSYILDTPLYVL